MSVGSIVLASVQSGGTASPAWLAWYQPYEDVLGPLGSVAAGVVAALSLFTVLITYILNNRREQRRRTLEACESFLLKEPVWPALCRIVIAVRYGDFPLDTVPEQIGSLRNDVSLVINQVETTCQGVVQGFYSGTVVLEYLETYVEYLVTNFLSEDPLSPPAVSMRWYDVEFANTRRVFGYPRYEGLRQPGWLSRLIGRRPESMEAYRARRAQVLCMHALTTMLNRRPPRRLGADEMLAIADELETTAPAGASARRRSAISWPGSQEPCAHRHVASATP
jgi:hypothetical protein